MKKGYHIILTGKEEHPEIQGTSSYCGCNYTIVNDIEDIDNIEISSIGEKVAVISQTTFGVEQFHQITERLKDKLGTTIEIEVLNTICGATAIRQEEVQKIAKEVDFMIIIGGKNSTNTKNLYKLACKYCKNCVHIETKNELETSRLKEFKKVGIMAGASTPKKSIEEVVEMLRQV